MDSCGPMFLSISNAWCCNGYSNTGVDYLAPGALTKSVSYVFGPVLKLLKSVGYQEGVDLDAAPYDWRIPPSELQSRDSYFTNTMNIIEYLSDNTNGKPVMLLCHSLGCKTAHYLLNFALNYPDAGQKWLDRYIHSYVPVGAPHFGVPKSIRAIIDGDKMGLEAFLDDSEGLMLCRSFGSGPWLFPTKGDTSSVDEMLPNPQLPPQSSLVKATATSESPSALSPVSSCASSFPMIILRRESTLRITIPAHEVSISTLIKRVRESPPSKLRLALDIGTITLRTNFQPVLLRRTNNLSSFVVNFVEETFIIACPPDLVQTSMIFNQCQLHLEKPGVGPPRRKKRPQQSLVKRNRSLCEYIRLPYKYCDCILKWIIFLPCFLFNRFAKWLMGSTKRIADSDIIDIKCHFTSIQRGGEEHPRTLGKFFDLRVNLKPRKEFHHGIFGSKRFSTGVLIKFQWEPPSMDSPSATVSPSSDLMESNTSRSPLGTTAERYIYNKNSDDIAYLASGMHKFLHMENLSNVLHLLNTHYANDSLGPHSLSSYQPPPIHKVIAIYGVNLPTEIGAVYRRNPWLRISSTKIRQYFILDKEAKLTGGWGDLYELEKGVIRETMNTPQNVPVWSSIDSDNHLSKNGDFNVKNNKKKPPTEKNVIIQRSGDGTVPYWSLQQCRRWQGQGPAKCDVSVHEINGADHREILNDTRFHRILLTILGFHDNEKS